MRPPPCKYNCKKASIETVPAKDKAGNSKKQSATGGLCSSITGILTNEIGKTKNKTKSGILKGGLKYANEICDAGGVPDLAKITKGLPKNDKLRISQKTNAALFDGAADLNAKDLEPVSSNQPAELTGKGGRVTDLKGSAPDLYKLSPVTEFSLSGTKLSGETPGQAATKQSPILLASASQAKSPADTAAAAKTAGSTQKVSAAGTVTPFDWPTVPCNCTCAPNILGYSVKDCVTRCNILCGDEECSAGYVLTTSSGCCLASQVTTTGICCSPGQTPAADGTCGCSAGKVTIVGPTELFLFKHFSFLFISYPRSPKVSFKITTTKPPSKILWWASNEKVKFTSGTNQLSVEVIPTLESESVGDVTITVAVDNCPPVPLPLTVRRPKSVSHQPLLVQISDKGSAFGIGTAGQEGLEEERKFPWTLVDQLGDPMPNTLVKEEVKKKWLGSSIWALWPPWPWYKIETKATTNTAGQFGDRYYLSAYFPIESFRKDFVFHLRQKLEVNSYEGFSDVKFTLTDITGTDVELK